MPVENEGSLEAVCGVFERLRLDSPGREMVIFWLQLLVCRHQLVRHFRPEAVAISRKQWAPKPEGDPVYCADIAVGPEA
jgi:hypothetical protein